jgi:hypothetical protein
MLDKNERPGAFKLSDVNLVSYTTGTTGILKRLNIKNLITEINIYESLEGTFLSGDMVITDATNAIEQFPLTGFERLEFILTSPNTTNGFNFSVFNGHPMFVYSLKHRQNINLSTQMYVLKFISLEAIRDQQTRISKAFTGSIDQMISDVCFNYLNTKKDVLVEETKGNHKFVSPLVKPSVLLTTLKDNARSKNYENSGFVFYENANGFNFKSYEGLFCKKDGSPRPVKINYTFSVKNLKKRGDAGKEVDDLQGVESWKILNQYDTLKNITYGVYASRLITHDSFNKTFNEHDFNYHLEYIKQNHLEQDANGGKRDNNSILPLFNYDKGQTFSSKSESALFFQSQTNKIHNDYEIPEQKDILQKRTSQHRAINSLRIEITVPGISEVRVGDICSFTLPNFRRTPKDELKTIDKYISGRYLINAVRHHVSNINKRHTMVLELIKDSFNVGYPEEDTDYFTNNEDDRGLLYSASQLDEFV